MIKDIWEKELTSRRIPFISDLNLIAMLIDAPTIGGSCSSIPHFDYLIFMLFFKICFAAIPAKKLRFVTVH